MVNENIVYIFNDELLAASCKHPVFKYRSSMVHELIKASGLLNHLRIVKPKRLTYEELRIFHKADYLNCLRNIRSYEDETSESVLENYGLEYDCPIWPEIFDYCLWTAGSTLEAVRQIKNGSKLVINWFGGSHHARSDKAAGYCYVNDIVLGILELRKVYERILYIDLDVHHGDAVEDAFEASKRVFTISFHQHEPGFYPGTGKAESCGFGSSKGYSINFPYRMGITGEQFQKYFSSIIRKVSSLFKPQVCIVQCGGDVIVGDPLGNANLLPEDVGKCIEAIMFLNIPTILLGGGGYNFANTSRLWTYLTSLICGIKLPTDIPDHEYFLNYSPSYEFGVERTKVLNYNDEEYLKMVLVIIEGNLAKIQQTQ